MLQKNEGNDAQAICEAVGRPSMRFVAVKSAEQQALLTVHRVRGELVQARTALSNQTLAAKNARTIWALQAKDETYRAPANAQAHS